MRAGFSQMASRVWGEPWLEGCREVTWLYPHIHPCCSPRSRPWHRIFIAANRACQPHSLTALTSQRVSPRGLLLACPVPKRRNSSYRAPSDPCLPLSYGYCRVHSISRPPIGRLHDRVASVVCWSSPIHHVGQRLVAEVLPTDSH